MSEELEWLLSTPSGSSASTATDSVDRRTQGDVLLLHTQDGGEINCTAGIIELSLTPRTAAYLSLFGGNEEDSGLTDGEREQWWANFEEATPERRQRSQLQFLLGDIPATPFNLQRIEDAAKSDLAWMLDGFADAVAVEASLVALNTVNVHVDITIGAVTYPFDFLAPWGTAE